MRVVSRQTMRNGRTDDRVFTAEADGRIVVALADGAGGMPGGAEAADTLVEVVRERWESAHFPTTSYGMCDLLSELDIELHRHPHAGETTAVVLLAEPGSVVGASCGDSECWLVTDDSHHVLTAGQHRKRLGSGKAQPEAFGPYQFRRGRLLLASDGLFGFVAAGKVASLCREGKLDRALAALIEAPRSREGTYGDDVSIVLLV